MTSQTDPVWAKLEKSYSAVYKGERLGSKVLTIGKWPRNRWEACIFWAPKGERVLDVGCGHGIVLFNLKDKFKELYGIELSKARVETARKTLAGYNTHIVEGNIELGTPFDEAYFDVVICSDVIEHVIDVKAAFWEMHRLLRKGGSLVLNTPNVARWKGRLTLLFGKFPSTSAPSEGIDVRAEGELLDGGHLHYFTFSLLNNLCREVGFSQVSNYGFGRMGVLHNLWPSLLSGSCQIVARK